MTIKKEHKMLCPKCKNKDGRFIRKEKTICYIIDDCDGLRDEVIQSIDYEFNCDNCENRIGEEDLIKEDFKGVKNE